MNGKIFTINSVLSGTFYRRSSPEEPPYVEEGDKVNPGQVVCIVESMKIFNEVRVERRGIIRKILIEDEDTVLIHQPMFEVEVI
jgi:acetyl-CoA carboxylase biotin carboxyl carrier protein